MKSNQPSPGPYDTAFEKLVELGSNITPERDLTLSEAYLSSIVAALLGIANELARIGDKLTELQEFNHD